MIQETSGAGLSFAQLWELAPRLLAGYEPFATAALALVGLVAIELMALVVGASLMGLGHGAGLDHGAEAHGADSHGADSHHAGFDPLGWLNVGRAPLAALVMLLLGAFSGAGFLFQGLATRAGAPLPVWAASLAALALALPLTRAGSRLIARLLPRDETYAIDDDDLLGLVGEVTVGPLEADFVGRAKVSDRHGNRHYPRVRPAEPGEVIAIGEKVLLVERAGREFRVLRAPAALL